MNASGVLRSLVFSGLAIVSFSHGRAVAQMPSVPAQSSAPVAVYLTITAKTGVAISADSLGLTATIDKQSAQIAALRPAREDSLAYAVLLDCSSSNAKTADEVRSATARIFRALSDRGQGYFGVFDVALEISHRPLSPPEVESVLAHVTFRGGTALFDAIGQTSSKILSRQHSSGAMRRILVVITDGDDDQSHTYLKDAIEAAEREGVTIFSLATSNRPDRGWEELARASRETGGEAVQAYRIENEIEPLLAAIDGQWALSLNAAQLGDQNLHRLKVKSALKGVSLTAPDKIPLQ